jgi:hypothetical protein
VGLEIWLYLFLTSALDEGEWLTSHPGFFTAGKEPQYPSWVFPRVNLDISEKRKISCPYWDSNPNCTTHSLVIIICLFKKFPCIGPNISTPPVNAVIYNFGFDNHEYYSLIVSLLRFL